MITTLIEVDRGIIDEYDVRYVGEKWWDRYHEVKREWIS